MDVPVRARRGERQANPLLHTLRGASRASARKVAGSMLPRKTSKRVHRMSVPQTDTGRRGEYPKVFELTRVKELGKMVP
jgi:hypothetical protein